MHIRLKDNLIKAITSSLIIIFIICSTCSFFVYAVAEQDIEFTQEEIEYIENAGILKVISIKGIAPLAYIDSKGDIKGIGIVLLNEISNMTGLEFSFKLFDSVEDSLNDSFDVYANAEKKYAPTNMLLSNPYLMSETVLFYNKSLDPEKLFDKKYAAVAGGSLLESIEEENVIYFPDREAAINAVDQGRADYGFGNAYSLAFYNLQNSYKNIVTIPTGEEERAYCIGVLEGNEVLLSIINKSIDAIGKNRMDVLVLSVASQVERNITASMLVDLYWKQLLIILIIFLFLIAYIHFIIIRSKIRISRENERYKLVAQISNDYLFEYNVKSKELFISEKFSARINALNSKDRISRLLEEALENPYGNEDNIAQYTINLPFTNGDIGIFRVILSYLKNKNQKIYSVIGKLVDITHTEKEKQLLIAKAQIDGLTGLYNMASSKEKIIKSINNRQDHNTDALIILDCDKFKDINDIYGHLQGNEALKHIADALIATFDKSDILGRLGGDEFWIYMHSVKSKHYVKEKCEKLIRNVNELNKEFAIEISMGASLINSRASFEDLFLKADRALYLAKKDGNKKIVVCEI